MSAEPSSSQRAGGARSMMQRMADAIRSRLRWPLARRSTVAQLQAQLATASASLAQARQAEWDLACRLERLSLQRDSARRACGHARACLREVAPDSARVRLAIGMIDMALTPSTSTLVHPSGMRVTKRHTIQTCGDSRDGDAIRARPADQPLDDSRDQPTLPV
jgi:hypothetical protein